MMLKWLTEKEGEVNNALTAKRFCRVYTGEVGSFCYYTEYIVCFLYQFSHQYFILFNKEALALLALSISLVLKVVCDQ